MSNKPVYVVRHYSYDYHEFERLIGLAATKEVAERMARNNEHVYDDCDVENAAQITHARGSALSSGWGGISWTKGYDADGRMKTEECRRKN